LKRAEPAVQVTDDRLSANLMADERREFKRILHAVGLRCPRGYAGSAP
jgi:hypothetical protein